MIGPPSQGFGQTMPSKIQAAMDYLRFAHAVKSGECGLGSDWKKEGRDLTASEQKVYDAALATLLRYFNSGGFGAEFKRDDNPPDDPKGRVPTT